MDFVACQPRQPGEDIAVGPRRIVVIQFVQGPEQGFLDDLFTEVLVTADAIEAETVQRQKHGVG